MNAKRNPRRNHYPTVKPLSLMRYLVTLVTREGGVVLDPFMGSGTTAVACALGRDFIGCEMDAEYYAIAQARVERATLQMPLRLEQGAEIPPRPYR